GAGLCDGKTDGLELEDRASELRACASVRDRSLERGSRDADRLRRDADAAAVESREREREALADIAEHRSGPDPRIFEHDAARVGGTKTHLRFGLADREAHRLSGHDERGDARVRASGLRGRDAREDDEERGVPRARDELLSPVEAPAIAVAHGDRLQRRRVGARRRLGERERTETAAVHEARQPLRALLIGAVADDRAGDDPAVDRHANGERRPCGGEFLEHERECDRREAHSTVALGDRHAEHAERAELADDLERERPLTLAARDPPAEALGPGTNGERKLAFCLAGLESHPLNLSAPPRDRSGLVGSLVAAKLLLAHSICALHLLHGLGECWYELEQVADHTVVRDLEDVGVGILVHRDDDLRGRHAREVLDRAGDPERDIEVGSHRLPGLPDLFLVRAPSRVASSAPSFAARSVQSAAYARPSFAATRAPRSRPLGVAPTRMRSASFAFSATALDHAIGE